MPARTRSALALVVLLCCSAEAPNTPAPTANGNPNAFDSEAMRAQLEALGYVEAALPAAELSGVVHHVPERAQPGWNLILSMHAVEASLVDMEGRVMHTWKAPEDEPPMGLWWRTAHLLANGDLIVQADYGAIAKLDRLSRLLWRNDAKTHHDFDVADDGRVFVLTQGTTRHPSFGHPIAEDFVAELSAEGELRAQISVLRAIENGVAPQLLEELVAFREQADSRVRHDVSHTNTVQLLPASRKALPDGFRPGNLLLSIPTVNVILILDPKQEKIVWSQKGRFRYQHDPTLTADGRLLLFDNRGAGERSRVVEIDPASGEELWAYGEHTSKPFATACCGRIQPLANGNLLIVVSQEGRAFELAPDGEVVWDFRTPYRVADKTAILADVVRISPDRLDPQFRAWLERPEVPGP